MSKYKVPKMVEEHYNQMKNTMELLENVKFASLVIPPKLISRNKNRHSISWDNQINREGVNAKNFSLIDSYEKVLLNRSFQILLFDSSIIRCSLDFEDDILITENFSWLPCPLNIESYELSFELGLELITEEIQEQKISKDRILLRSPVRFDYDNANDESDHPGSHVHLQNPETRINTSRPMCFNTFLKHIIEIYYPKTFYVKKNIVEKEIYEGLNTKKWSGLSFKTLSKRKKQIQYDTVAEYAVERLKMG